MSYLPLKFCEIEILTLPSETATSDQSQISTVKISVPLSPSRLFNKPSQKLWQLVYPSEFERSTISPNSIAAITLTISQRERLPLAWSETEHRTLRSVVISVTASRISHRQCRRAMLRSLRRPTLSLRTLRMTRRNVSHSLRALLLGEVNLIGFEGTSCLLACPIFIRADTSPAFDLVDNTLLLLHSLSLLTVEVLKYQ